MRLACLPTLGFVGLCVLLLTACSFERRSSDYACDIQADCDSGRVCTNNFCVEVTIDADPAAPDADDGTCPDICTECNLTFGCVITCAGVDSCAGPVVCPANWPCKVECKAEGACGSTIDCSAAKSCRIECTHPDTCQGRITCGPGSCRVECDGDTSCQGDIDCQASCRCNTFCTGVDSCAFLPLCPDPGGGNCINGNECVSNTGPCDACL